MNRKPRANGTSNIQLEIDEGVIAYMDRYEDYNKVGYRFSLDRFEGKQLISHMTARTITYDTLNAERYHWIAKNYMIRDLSGDMETISQGTELDTVIHFEPADFLITYGQEETMTSPELKEYIQRQKNRGFGNIQDFEIEYHKRYAMSFASFILTIIGVSLSSRKRKGGMGLHLGIGIGLSFAYIMFQTLASSFAGNMVLFPTVVMPVTVGRKSSLKLIQNASADGKQIAVFCQKDPDVENPVPSALRAL